MSISKITVISKNSQLERISSKEDLISNFDYIIRKYYEEPLVKKLISRHYPYYTREEAQQIISKVFNNMKENYGFFYIESSQILKSRINDYLDDNDIINLEGFVNFRLNSYIELLVDIISVSVEEYIIEKEYDEFISLMQSYVSLQHSKYNLMEVVMYNDGFIISDEFGNDITDICKADCLGQDFEIILRPEDLLLNILITTAPKKINIFNSNQDLYKEFLETVKKIFTDRLNIFSFEKNILNVRTDFSN